MKASKNTDTKKGYIYILTNPSFPEYVKIGFSHDPKTRLVQLNRSECTPYAFRLYATYEVNSEISDKRLHQLIDQLNPDLRSIDNYQGKQRVREFFAMSPEDAYSLLEAMAEIHGCKDKLKKYKKTAKDLKQEETAEEVKSEITRRGPFSFDLVGIQPGEEVCFVKDPTIKATVLDDKKVQYNGETMSLTGLAMLLLKTRKSIQGPRFFTYKGKVLTDLRLEMEQQELKKNFSNSTIED